MSEILSQQFRAPFPHTEVLEGPFTELTFWAYDSTGVLFDAIFLIVNFNGQEVYEYLTPGCPRVQILSPIPDKEVTRVTITMAAVLLVPVSVPVVVFKARDGQVSDCCRKYSVGGVPER